MKRMLVLVCVINVGSVSDLRSVSSLLGGRVGSRGLQHPLPLRQPRQHLVLLQAEDLGKAAPLRLPGPLQEPRPLGLHLPERLPDLLPPPAAALLLFLLQGLVLTQGLRLLAEVLDFGVSGGLGGQDVLEVRRARRGLRGVSIPLYLESRIKLES